MSETPARDTLHIGIDLGTSRSAISASNGTRAWTQSYVGWPRDFISAKVLGKTVLFGADALEHRMSLDLFRPLERGVIKEGIERNEEAVRELIRCLIDMAKPQAGQLIKAIVGVPADTLKTNKLAIRKAVQEYVHSLMVVSEPFAVAYSLDLLDNALIIDIGAGTVDFCIMHGAIPDEGDQKTILTAGDYVDEQFFSYLSEKYPESRFTLNMVRQFKEKHSFVGESEEKIEVVLPVNGKPVTHDITTEMRRACESILPAIVETASNMIARFDAEFQNRVKKNIVVAGGGSQIRGLADYISRGLKELGQCRVTTVQDPLFAGSDGGLKLATDMPEKYWEKLG
ncbi:MAG TPA: MamK family actin-like protein [Candidatus Methylomirabilis sp.]|nr:MamK family actin-like protein [Candidatus Methylomirabilis sp.]